MSSTSLAFPSPFPPAAPGALALQVLSGMHSGVDTAIETSACTVGSSPHCDLVLADENIAPDHLRLRFYGRIVAIDAVGGDVGIEGRAPLAKGRGCRATLPVTLVVGAARLRLARAEAGGFSPRRLWLYAAGLLAFALVPIVAVQAGISQLGGEDTAAGPAAPSLERSLAALPAPSAAVPAASDEQVVEALRTEISAAGLGSLDVSREGRRIVVAGQVPQDRLADWSRIQQSFDRVQGGRYIPASGVTAAAAAEAPSFDFQAVWFGENPYVLDARGERRYPGAALDDGWLLKAIEPGRILVGRGGEEFSLTL